MKFTLPNINGKIFFSKNVFFFGIILSFFSFFISSSPSLAIDTQTISAHPTYYSDTDPRSRSWFIYSLPAGITKQDSVTVVNNEKQPLTLKVYAVDSTKDNNGNFALRLENEKKTDIGAWVKISSSEVTLNPGEHKNIPFTISVPGNAKIGDHSGGIVFQLAPQKSTNTKGMAINVVSRVGVRIYETVPSADQLNMAVGNIKYSIENYHLAVTFTVSNNGTVHVSPTGLLEVKDMFGRVQDRIPLDSQLGIILPGKPLTLTIPTNALTPIFGWETASVAIYYSPTKAAFGTLVVPPSPWGAFIIAFIIFLLVAIVILKRHLVINKGKENQMVLAPHIWIYAGAILLGTIAFSAIIAFLLPHLLGGM